MSNLVLNDDSVVCHGCFEDMMTDLYYQNDPGSLPFGTTIHFPCRSCGEDPSPEQGTTP